MAAGIIVDHKETGIRYAVSPANFNEKVHTKVRPTKPGETVLGYKPRRKESLGDVAAVPTPPKPEGSASVGTPAIKEGK